MKAKYLCLSFSLIASSLWLLCPNNAPAQNDETLPVHITLQVNWKDCDGNCDTKQFGNHVSSGNYTINITGHAKASGGSDEFVIYEPHGLTANYMVNSTTRDISDKDCTKCNPVETIQGSRMSTFGKDANAIATVQAFMGTLGAGFAMQLAGELGPGYEKTLPKAKQRRIIMLAATAPFTLKRTFVEDCKTCKKDRETLEGGFGITINADMFQKKTGSASWTSSVHPLDGPGASVIDLGGRPKVGPDRDNKGRARYNLTWSLGEARPASLLIREIHFNYDSNSVPLFYHHSDQEIKAPEWTSQGERKSAAFIRGESFKVKAVLAIEGDRIEKADIWADEETDDASGSVKKGFEGIRKKTVTFKKGETEKEVEFSVKRPQTVIGVNPVKWFWRADVWFRGVSAPVEMEIKTDARQSTDYTEHTIYIVGAKPVKIKNAYEFAVKKGCQWAEGKTGGKEAFDAIWQKFQNIECPDGSACTLRYEHGNAPATTAGLLSSGRGRCGAWGNFFLDVIGSQGIPGAERVTVIPKSEEGLDAMIVKPLAAQGNPQPNRYFTNHVIVKYDGRFYDPSYHTDAGISAGEELHSYENQTFEAYCGGEYTKACASQCDPLPKTHPKFYDCIQKHCNCWKNDSRKCEVKRE